MNWNYKWNLNLSLVLLAAHVSGAVARETPLPPGKPVNIDFKSDYRIRSTPGGDRVVSLIRDVKQKHEKIKLTGRKETAKGRRWVEVSYGRKTGWISAYAVDRHLNIQSTQVAQHPAASAPAKVKVAESKPVTATAPTPKPAKLAPQTASAPAAPASASAPIKLASAAAPALAPNFAAKPEPKKIDTGKFGTAPKHQIETAPAKAVTEQKANKALTPPVLKKAEPAPRKLEVASAPVAPKDEKSVEPKKTGSNKPEEAKKETKPKEKPTEATKKEEAKPAEKPKVADKPAPVPERKLECAATAKELKIKPRLAEAIKKSGRNPFGVWSGTKSDLFANSEGKAHTVVRGLWAAGAVLAGEKVDNPTPFLVCVDANSDIPYVNVGAVKHLEFGKSVYLQSETNPEHGDTYQFPKGTR